MIILGQLAQFILSAAVINNKQGFIVLNQGMTFNRKYKPLDQTLEN